MKKINNFFFTEEEQHAENYAYFYGAIGVIIAVTTIAVIGTW